MVSVLSGQILGGHGERVVRVRMGQAAFRSKLLASYGPVCAFTGPTPPAALEAAHLYSYAKIGVHHDQGGLLIRRDLHRLFDAGLLAVNPETVRVDVSPELGIYKSYTLLHDDELRVELTSRQREWLAAHSQLHRVASQSGD